MEAGSSGQEAAEPERKAPEPGKQGAKRSPKRRRMMLRGGVVALAVLVGLIAWLATRGEDGESGRAPATAEPRIVSAAELGAIAAQIGHPVYWAGPMPGKVLEVTDSSDGNVEVRYPEAGTEPGQGPAATLTVGSYPLPDPAGAIDAVAARSGAIVRTAPDGRKVVANEGRPTSIYFASPDNSVQVEVYAPSPRRAMSLALSGKVQPASPG